MDQAEKEARRDHLLESRWQEQTHRFTGGAAWMNVRAVICSGIILFKYQIPGIVYLTGAQRDP